MNIYARIRKIEDHELFKRFFNTIMVAEYLKDFQAIKEWHDYGIDGYIKSRKQVFAVYCPTYPERVTQKNYTKKIDTDIKKLSEALRNRKVRSLKIEKWTFVTPDDLSVDIIDHIAKKAKDNNWTGDTMTAYVLSCLFMKHKEIYIDFPDIIAGSQNDKIPSISVNFVDNRDYQMLELFNNGTEDIESLDIEMSIDDKKTWRSLRKQFFYQMDNPVMASTHDCYNLQKGERQYANNVPTGGNFYFRVHGVGVESKRTFTKEDFVPLRS